MRVGDNGGVIDMLNMAELYLSIIKDKNKRIRFLEKTLLEIDGLVLRGEDLPPVKQISIVRKVGILTANALSGGDSRVIYARRAEASTKGKRSDVSHIRY